MGVIVRQSIKSSISSYLGAALGFVNVSIVMNQLFSPEEFGLRAALLDIAVIFSMVSQLGTARTIVKMYPFFSDGKKNDNGLFTYSLLFTFVGFTIIAGLLLFFKDFIISHFDKDSDLLLEYYWAIFPLTFFMLLNLMFESNLQARVRTAFSAFVNQVVVRVVMTVLLIFYYYKVIDFKYFIFLFVFSYAFNLLLYLIYLYKHKMLSIGLNRSYFRKKVRKIYLKYSLYSVWTNIAGTLTTKLDTMMLLYYLGLSYVAIYSNAIYLVMLVTIPANSIAKTSFPILAKHWKAKRIDLMEDLYKKSSINQFLLGGTLFILLWANLDNILSLQREIYANGKYIVLVIGLAQVFNMLTGVNTQIINASKYYPFLSITSSLLIFLIILTNYILIPIYGVLGAAIATAVSIVIFNTARLVYIYIKIGIHPFSKKILAVLISFIITLVINYFFKGVENIFIDTILRSIVIILIISTISLKFHLSNELNHIIKSLLKIKSKN